MKNKYPKKAYHFSAQILPSGKEFRPAGLFHSAKLVPGDIFRMNVKTIGKENAEN